VRSPAPQDYRVNLENRWHVVYRFFDGHGALLYVGISASAAGRLTAHAVDKPWFREVARAEFEHIHGRSAALERELEIIRAEHPLWNRAGTEKHTGPPMRAMVCGSRVWHDETAIHLRLALLPNGTSVIHGGARGVDTLADKYAKVLGHDVQVFKADWKTHGKAAGPIRNNEMLDTCPDVVIAFWDGVSKGTKHAIGEASRRGLAVEVYAPGDRDYGKVAA
jgi:hypothetical protein